MTARIHLFNKYLSSTYNISGPVVDAGDKAVKKAQQLMLCGAYILVWGVYKWKGRQSDRKEERNGGRSKKERKREGKKETESPIDTK